MKESPVIDVSHVSRSYGRRPALDDVSLEVGPGVVMGLVGENGAGKTTLVKHVLGLLRAQTGSVRVFGRDPVADPVGVLSRIGYLSEEGELPLWMTVGELLRYAESFYPTWDRQYANHLVKDFDLDLRAALSKVSKGQRSRAGLVVAMAYRPELLVLDEPSAGLDPLVRKDILGAVIRTVADDGRTVLFSSHLLAEVERVADRITIMKSGRILLSQSMDKVKDSHLRIAIIFDRSLEAAPVFEGCFGWEGEGRSWSCIYFGDLGLLREKAQSAGGRLSLQEHMSLDDIFVAHVGARPGGAA